MSRQAGRVAIVTGGGHGIGAAVCRRLAEDGATVAVLDLDAAAAVAVARELPHGAGIACDITDRARVPAAVAEVHERFGSVDILVNSAGTLPRNVGFLESTPGDWDAVIATNLTGTFTVTQAAARLMRDAGYGRITMVASLAALGNAGQAAYAASKAGLSGLARTIAIELGGVGVTCNVVAPGFVDTGMLRRAVGDREQSFEEFERLTAERIPVGRLGQPEDIAAAIALLSLPETGFVTGQVLYATGGPTA